MLRQFTGQWRALSPSRLKRDCVVCTQSVARRVAAERDHAIEPVEHPQRAYVSVPMLRKMEVNNAAAAVATWSSVGGGGRFADVYARHLTAGP